MSPNNDGASKLGRNPRTPGDYEIGYGRPPHEHQFKKGEPSRNPKGRSPGGSKPAGEGAQGAFYGSPASGHEGQGPEG
jgi:hypothetical protein